MNDQSLSRSKSVLNTHNEVVGCAGAVFPKAAARPLDRVANLVIVAARKEIMSQGIILDDLKLVLRLLNGEFFRKNMVQPCSSSSLVAGAS